MNIESVLPIMTEGNTLKVTSPFGYRVDPVTGVGNGAHKGIDLTCWKGWSALSGIGAAWDGVVKVAYDNVEGFSTYESRGNYVIIDHGNGLETHYYHLAHGSITVSTGDAVTAGQQIGYMGSTGYSTGAHLHFQIELNDVPVDPQPYITGEVYSDMNDQNMINDPEMDNTPSEWSEEAVQWAVDNGIMYGDENGNYRLRDYCTREQMLVFLYRALHR